MRVINDIQIEVSEIIILKNTLLNKRNVFTLKRTLFIAEIKSIMEHKYLVENNYASCSMIILEDEFFKVKDDYSELLTCWTDWWNSRPKD